MLQRACSSPQIVWQWEAIGLCSVSLSVFPESLKSTLWSLVDWKRLELGAPLALLPLLLFPVYSEFLKTVDYLEVETWAESIWSPIYSMVTEPPLAKIPFISGQWALVIDWVSVGEKMMLVSPDIEGLPWLTQLQAHNESQNLVHQCPG